MFGPVTTSMRRAASSTRSLGTNGPSMKCSTTGWRPPRISMQRLGDELRLGPAELRGAFGERAQAVERRPARSAVACSAREPVGELRQQLLVQLALARQRLLARAQHLVLEALELGRDEALGVLQRLAADVVLRHVVGLRARDLDVEAVHAVVAELQRWRCRCARARGVRARAGTRRCAWRCWRSSSSSAS